MGVSVSVILGRKESSEVVSASPDATVLEAVHLMNRERVGAVLVCGTEGAVGIFTERDVLVRVVAVGLDPAVTLVANVMTRPFIAVRASTTAEEAMRIMTSKRCRHLPVQGEGDKIVGMISIGDLIRWTVRDQGNQIEGLYDYITGRYPT